MNVLHNFTCIYHYFDATVVKQKLGDNIVTVTNNVLDTFLKIFAVVKFLPDDFMSIWPISRRVFIALSWGALVVYYDRRNFN